VNDERAAEGVQHLQTAAQELIEAARAFLDVVEDYVGDEQKMASVADAVASVARGVRSAADRPDTGTTDEPAPGTGAAGASGSVQHIRVS
jgi:plasmid stabilization system protein ParE